MLAYLTGIERGGRKREKGNLKKGGLLLVILALFVSLM